MAYCSECFDDNAPFDGSSDSCMNCEERRAEKLAAQEADTLELTPLELGDISIALMSYGTQARRSGRDATARSYWVLAAKVEDLLDRVAGDK